MCYNVRERKVPDDVGRRARVKQYEQPNELMKLLKYTCVQVYLSKAPYRTIDIIYIYIYILTCLLCICNNIKRDRK